MHFKQQIILRSSTNLKGSDYKSLEHAYLKYESRFLFISYYTNYFQEASIIK